MFAGLVLELLLVALGSDAARDTIRASGSQGHCFQTYSRTSQRSAKTCA